MCVVTKWPLCITCRVGQNRIYTPYMTVNLVISLSKIPCIHGVWFIHLFTYTVYIWFWPTLKNMHWGLHWGYVHEHLQHALVVFNTRECMWVWGTQKCICKAINTFLSVYNFGRDMFTPHAEYKPSLSHTWPLLTCCILSTCYDTWPLHSVHIVATLDLSPAAFRPHSTTSTQEL
jgi:hypothetical protein